MINFYDMFKLVNVKTINLPHCGEFKTSDRKKSRSSSILNYGKVSWRCTKTNQDIQTFKLRDYSLDLVKLNQGDIPYITGRLYICPECNDILYYFGYGDYVLIRNDVQQELINNCNYFKEQTECIIE